MSEAQASTRSLPSSPSRSRRNGCGVPVAIQSGARSSEGWGAGGAISRTSGSSSAMSGLEEVHPGLHEDLDEAGFPGAERGRKRFPEVLETLRLMRLHAVAGGDLRRIQLRQVKAGRAVHRLGVGEPFEDR